MIPQNLVLLPQQAEYAYQMNPIYAQMPQHHWMPAGYSYNPHLIQNIHNNASSNQGVAAPSQMRSMPQQHYNYAIHSSEVLPQSLDSFAIARNDFSGQKSHSFSSSTISTLKIEELPTTTNANGIAGDCSYSPDSAPVAADIQSISPSSSQNLRTCGIAMLTGERKGKFSIKIECSVRPKHIQKKTKQDYYNDSNYTKNLLKGFKRYLRRFEADISRKADIEIFDGSQLNNELVLKLFSHAIFAKSFTKFLEQSPNWWIEQAKIKDVEKQIAFFHLCRSRAFNLIRTKRKTFLRPV